MGKPRIALAAALATAATAASAQVEYYYVTTDTTPRYHYYEPAPVYYVERVYTEPKIVVEAPRYYSDDYAITADVVDALASDPRLSGNIGVETWRGDVTLSGRVTTPGQALIAQRNAQGVAGVREVTSTLRTRVGGSY